MPRRVESFKPPGWDRQQAANKKAYDNSRQRLSDLKFYNGSLWKNLRRQHLNTEPTCRECAKEGRTTEATFVHHDVERHIDLSRQLDPTNLISLCASHHTALHNKRRGNAGGVGR